MTGLRGCVRLTYLGLGTQSGRSTNACARVVNSGSTKQPQAINCKRAGASINTPLSRIQQLVKPVAGSRAHPIGRQHWNDSLTSHLRYRQST